MTATARQFAELSEDFDKRVKSGCSRHGASWLVGVAYHKLAVT